jgi:hypothetical protein
MPQASPVATATATPSPTTTPVPTPTPGGFETDASLFRLITVDEPFQSYRAFPNAEELTSGRLNGSDAHPTVRVRLNTPAFQSLENGKLPAGGRFRNGSVIVKEVLSGSQAPLYAVMRKDGSSPTAGASWQWAEYRPDGSVVYSINGRGGVCISCHSREQGPQNDLVRTFERQR